MGFDVFRDEDNVALNARMKARGKGRKYDIDQLKEWGIFTLPSALEGKQLVSAVNSVIAAGKRRGWELVRTGTHRITRVGDPKARPLTTRLEDAL